jgi:Protein of unknown function (DUF3987)/Primase C terminal 2 (PriCT-2)/Bifunctional DNA primase/polymerase, N-terminal
MIADYIQHGWQLCQIPHGKKGPITPGWNREGIKEAPAGECNAGLLHSLSGTCALDLDDLLLAAEWLAERGVDLRELLSAPTAVQVVSGRVGSAKLLYALPMPLPSRKVIVAVAGQRKVALELRCASADGHSMQDVLPPSRHPSGTVYTWRGDWRNLPPIPQALIDVWSALLAEEGERRLPTEMGGRPAAKMSEIASALNACDPDCDRQTWIEVGMAVHDAATTADCLEIGFDLWNDWSGKSTTKYPGEREMSKQWASFRAKPDGITVATLFKHAGDRGWTPPPPDLTGLFKPIELPKTSIEEKSTFASVKDKLSPAAILPEINLKLWPEMLVARATEISEEVGCDVAVPLLAGLSAVSGAADKRISLRITQTWKVPPVFWTMTIGEPADKKTPGSKPMFTPLRQLEAEDKARFEIEKLMWLGKEARYAAQQKAYRDWSASPEATIPGSIPPTVDQCPHAPEPLRILVTDSTSQKFVTMAQYRPRGFLMWLDEMASWLARMLGARSTEDRGCWIQTYETGPYAFDRVGSGSILVEHLASSIYGNCQPEVFRRNVTEAATDGMIQRFLPVVLNTSKNAMWQNSRPDFASHRDEYEQLIRRTFMLPEFEYGFAPDANELFREFCEWCLRFRDNERHANHSSTYQTALGKMEGNAARLILISHLIDDPFTPFVSRATAKRAIDLFHKFFIPMLRHSFLEIGKQRDVVGIAIFDYIIQQSGMKPTVTLGEIRRVCKHLLGDVGIQAWQSDAIIRSAMDELASINYVVMHQDHPKNPTWAVNPSLATVFANHRKAVIESKQRVIEQMRVNIGEGVRLGDAHGYCTL